jgi:AraC-like DNA-binding protein
MNGDSYAIDKTLSTLLKDMGVSPANALRRAGLPDDLLQQCSTRLSPADYHRLWQGIEEEAGVVSFPVSFCEALRAESFSPPLFAALCSPNLAVAAERVTRYKAIVAPMRFNVVDADDLLTIELQWSDSVPEPPLSLVMAELLTFVALARIGTRERICPVAVSTTRLPAPHADYEGFLGGPLVSGPVHSICFAAADAVRPFLTSCSALWDAFEPELRRRLADLDAGVATTRRVQAVLLEGLPAGLVTMEAVARKLAMGKRTLQRRIVAEGSSYQRILNQTREALARHYLENTVLPAAEISFLLGFDEPNSFYRAFRGWTGATPDSVRHPRPDHH